LIWLAFSSKFFSIDRIEFTERKIHYQEICELLVTNPDTSAPTVNLTYPANNSEFDDGTELIIKGDASDNDSISKVEFLIDGTIECVDTETPYEFLWNTAGKVGIHTIMLKAYDPSNNIGSSSLIEITIKALNNPPVINSITALDISIIQKDSVLLTCNATDNDSDNLTYTWSSYEGEIIENFEDATWISTENIGSFYISCMVSDGEDTDKDSLLIYVLPDFVYVEGGTFLMGSDSHSTELPIHSVTIDNFYIGKCEVTQYEWKEFMNLETVSFAGVGNFYPVYYASWYEALIYCNKKSMAEGLNPCYKINNSSNPDYWGEIPTESNSAWNSVTCDWNANGYRLPTEAEWEYAARGGIHSTDDYIYSGSNNIDEVAWCGNYQDSTHPVASKAPNQLGVFDMSGNVCEMCWDWHDSEYYAYSPSTNPTGPTTGTNKMCRGGTWLDSAWFSRVALRYYFIHTPYYEDYPSTGFRIVRRP